MRSVLDNFALGAIAGDILKNEVGLFDGAHKMLAREVLRLLGQCEPKVKPEPPKPERVARLLLINSWGNETYQVIPWDGVGTIPPGFSVYREILPGDEHDKR